jgi:hypothetical protein
MTARLQITSTGLVPKQCLRNLLDGRPSLRWRWIVIQV